MDLADALIASPAARPDRLAQARSRLAASAPVRASAWPAFGAACLFAAAALCAAAAVILGGPALGQASTKVFAPVSRTAAP